MNCNRLTCCRHPAESGGLNIILSPRWPGGEGRVRGADEPVRGAAHLTLPSLREGPLPLPPKGGEGPVPGTQRGSLGGEGQRSSLLRGAERGEALLRVENGGTLLRCRL